MNDRALDRLDQRARHAPRGIRHALTDRGHTHRIAGGKTLLRTRTPTVHAHFAAPDQAEYTAARHVPKQLSEHFVESQSLQLRVDLHVPDSGLTRRDSSGFSRGQIVLHGLSSA
jgi:hypothetical protein